jgi:two-component system response regulator AtoC
VPGVSQVSDSMVANGPRMRALAAFIRWNADDRASMLITGEPGSGRQYLARALHDASGRQGGGFAVIPADTLTVARFRSELIRHATLVISGIEAISADVLTAIPPRLDGPQGRIIATGSASADRRPFRGRVIEVPSLRERREDIAPLVSLFLGRPVSPSALETLLEYDWPGNVRELRDTCGWIGRTCRCRVVKRGCLPARIPVCAGRHPRPEAPRPDVPCLDERLARFESGIISAALEAAGYNRSRAARLLGIKRSTLVDRIRRLGIGMEEEVRCA